MPRPLTPYILKAKELSAEEFVRHFPAPVLLVVPFKSLAETGFRTMTKPLKVLTGDDLNLGGEMERPEPQTVAPVVKREGSNTFGYMVTIGRAQNNDIELKAPGVSKFHAFIVLGRDGEPDTIADSNSTHHTIVDGVILEPQKPVPLASGTVVQFANVTAWYLNPSDFYARLRLMRDG